MYIEGSNAYKTEYYTYDAPVKREEKIKNLPKKKSSVAAERAAAKARRKKVVRMKKRAICAVGILFVMAFTILIRYAAITQEFDELTKTKAELELVSAQVVEKKMQAEGNLDPKRIEQEAERLGLRPPSKEQIRYISLGNTDNGEVLKTEETSGLSAFINRMSVILEYLN
ncbi:MAG: hypothetical protein IJZ81_03710 [Clostridia bacterium]|nr:hypothetical protein [Clostridia bacterium]